MEDVMNSSSHRQCQLIRHITNVFQHLIGPEELRSQPPCPAHGETPPANVGDEPHPLTHYKLHQVVAAIIYHLVVLLCLLQAIADLCQKFILLGHGSVHCR